MTRHSSIFLFACVLALFARDAVADDRPNVLIILCDDLGFADLGCYGGEIETPTLNRLAENGLRFSQFYNCAKCETSRATLISGLYHNEAEIAKLAHSRTIAETMREAGYHTIMTGKWHMRGEPTEKGFDRYFGHLSGATNFFTGDETFRIDGEKFEVPKQGYYNTDAVTDYTIQFLKDWKSSDKPFFGYVAYNAPHYPLQAPEEDVRKYLGKYKIGWDELRKRRYAKQQKLGIFEKPWTLSPRPDDVPTWNDLSDEKQEWEDFRMATFAAMVDRMDRQIGRIVSWLDESGELDNTLIMFLSDNGACPFERTRGKEFKPWDARSYWTYDKGWAHAGNTPFRRYKQNQHEGGISTPMIVHWPAGLKVKPGSVTHQVGHLVDLYATASDVAQTTRPDVYNGEQLKTLRGKSLTPIFAGKTRKPHEALYFDFAGKDHAVRMGKWKISSAEFGPWELYNMDVDRTELNDLAEKMPEKLAEMKAMWESWAAEVGAKDRRKPGSKKR